MVLRRVRVGEVLVGDLDGLLMSSGRHVLTQQSPPCVCWVHDVVGLLCCGL